MLNSINLLPWREAQKEAHKKRFINMMALGVLTAAGLQWFAGWYLEGQNEIQKQRLVFLNNHITQLDTQIEALKAAEQQHKELKTRLSVVESLQQKRNKTTQFMDLIPTLIPEGVYVDQIKLNDQSVEMIGISDSTSRLATMLNLLENSPFLSDVEMHSIVSGKQRFDKAFKSFKVSFLFQMVAKETPDLEAAVNEGV